MAPPFEWPERIEFVHTGDAGLARLRQGRGFSYLTPEGRRVVDRFTMARIAAIAIPPAWTGVWIAVSAHAHLQATGRDKRRRKQYRYHPVWAQKRRQANYARLPEFARALPQIRGFVDAGLRKECLERDHVLALALRFLDGGMIRIGNEEYEKANGSRGLTTLRKRNVVVNGKQVRFKFVGKGGIEYDWSISDARAARAVRRCHELPGQRLFRYLDDAGAPQPINSSDINSLLASITGQHFTAKDFRTWAGSVLAFEALAGREAGGSESETAQIVNDAIAETAQTLGNTLAVCKRYYVHPRIVEAFAAGELARLHRGTRRIGGLTRAETALLKFLEKR